ncbi:Uncharacterised protein [Helicobacter fennelliae]|uniref:Uncharacterized protein n=1 Tax=Helicobacter fennelliae TaxID=215 RepID=A0A2X3ELP5_9HELI|nr:hypothetical protein [Helicobacter fennelliae]SQC36294.1 Uncharacterised protein [Helicobacter fennelliae]
MKKRYSKLENERLNTQALRFFEYLDNEAKEAFIIQKVRRSKEFKQYLLEKEALLQTPSLFSKYELREH